MSLSPAYSQMFADMFAVNFADLGSRLDQTVQNLDGLTGDGYALKQLAQVSMDNHGAYGAGVPSKNVNATSPMLRFVNKDLKLSIDEFEQMNLNVSILQGYSELHAEAVARQLDQLIIDAVNIDATKLIGDAGTNMTVSKLLDARALLGEDGVVKDLHIVCHQNQIRSLLLDPQVSSADYNTVRTLMTGEIDTYLNFKFHVLGNRPLEGGLPLNSSLRSCFAYAKRAVTLGYRKKPEIRTVEKPGDLNTETLSFFSAGAKVGDARGVVKINCDETA